MSRKIKTIYCTKDRFREQIVNDQPQLVAQDRNVLYTPALERCLAPHDQNPETTVTMLGTDTIPDQIQLCQQFMLNWVYGAEPAGSLLSEHLHLKMHDITTMKSNGQTPVDLAMDATHMIVRAVSRLFLYVCNFVSLLQCARSNKTGVRYQCNRVLVFAHAPWPSWTRRRDVGPTCSLEGKHRRQQPKKRSGVSHRRSPFYMFWVSLLASLAVASWFNSTAIG